MKLKEAIDIGRAMNCITIGDVDYLIGILHFKHNEIDTTSFDEYCDDFDFWCDIYEKTFPNEHFVDCKI